MKESIALSTSCETAAVRIHRWIGKDKESLLHQWNKFVKERRFSTMYKCDLVKPPKIPPQLDRLSQVRYPLSKKKRVSSQRVITRGNVSGVLNYSLNQKYPFHYSNPLLSSDRVVLWPFKEHFYVCKQLRQLAKQVHTGPRWHKVVTIKSSEEGDDLEPNPYLEGWGQRTEERQFQITRVIKYLSH